jgi:hypothetical protein
MTGIEKAVAEVKSTPLGEKILWTKIARKHGVAGQALPGTLLLITPCDDLYIAQLGGYKQYNTYTLS